MSNLQYKFEEQDLTNENLLSRREVVLPKAIPQSTSHTVAEGLNATLRDITGRELIDFAGGIGVATVGHGHPRVVGAIKDQAEKLLHSCFQVATYEVYVELCEKLTTLFPLGDSTKAALFNSGAEAVENAVKIARQATGKSSIVSFTGGFHGRTNMCMSLTSNPVYKQGCGPFAGETVRFPFPNYFLRGRGLSHGQFVQQELVSLEQAFAKVAEVRDLAAVIIEPIQGEGGFVPAPLEYLQKLRELCTKHEVLLIVDEIQSGFCRTGAWAAYEHAKISPDLCTLGKALGGGMPISAVVGRADLMDRAAPKTLGGTFGGNPVCCASALAAIEVMQEQNLNERACELGAVARARLEELQARHPIIGEVRGTGAMLGVEFGSPKTPRPDLVQEILQECHKRDLIILPAGPSGNVIRFLFPLTIEEAELRKGLQIFSDVVSDILSDEAER